MNAKEATQTAASEFPPLSPDELASRENDERNEDNIQDSEIDGNTVAAGVLADIASQLPDDGQVTLAMFADKPKANIREVVQWVFDFMEIDDVTPDMAPSSGAWGLLKWARASRNNKTEFYRTLYAKFIPSKAQIDNEDKFADDGRKQLDILDRITTAYKDALLSSRSERPGGECCLSTGRVENGSVQQE
jgi:hypothetical protein